MNNKLISILIVIIGLGFIALTLVYILTPANMLPSFIPGYNPNLTRIHYTHAVGSLSLGLLLFAGAWFYSGNKSSQANG